METKNLAGWWFLDSMKEWEIRIKQVEPQKLISSKRKTPVKQESQALSQENNCNQAHHKLRPITSIEQTVSTAAAIEAAEYPKGERNPPFRSFSYLIAS